MEPSLHALPLPNATLLGISLPASYRPPNGAHATPVLAIVLQGELLDQGSLAALELAPREHRLAPSGERHRLEAGAAGLRCLVVELPAATRWVFSAGRKGLDTSLAALAQRVAALLPSQEPALRLRARRLGAEVGARAARLGRGLEDPDPPSWLVDVRAALSKEDTSAGLAALGRRAGIHPVHVARSFREHFGCSIGEFLRLRRLEEACALLQSGHGELADVAADTGFADQAHLTRCTRRALGVTPGQLRRAADVSRVQDVAPARR